MVKYFTERPVLSTVVSIIIVLLGLLAVTTLPVTEYPDIAPPTVQVNATYPGANAETVMESVVIPIEEQINGVEGMTYMTSSADNRGGASINVFFEQGIDPDIAAVNVQNRVARATPLLPREVTQSGVTTQKQQTSALMFQTVYSKNPEYDATYIQNYLNIHVLPELQRIKGIGDVNVFGARNYAMRIWLKPDRLAAYNLIPTDVIAAINEQSLEAAAGSLGQNNAEAFEYVIKYGGRYNEAEEYGNIIIRALGGGKFLRVKDVADVELDAEFYAGQSFTDGNPGVSMAIYQTPGSNAQRIIEDVHAKMDELKADFPEGLEILVNYDTNEFLSASISKVITTLLEAFFLVFLVVYIFLQDVRSTLIPAIAVPVSIIGTFFFLSLFGYSINLLTLFALVLAIGIVVDDAIVVVEAVHAKIEEGATSAMQATHDAMGEITGAIISITLVMAAVFIPVTFVQGPTGVFYEQFGVTLMVAIAISAINALTLSPALCAIVLKPQHENKNKGGRKNLLRRFFSAFNAGFSATTKRYVKSLHFLGRHKWIVFLILILSVGGIYWGSLNAPTGFVPNEDRGMIFVNVELPAGASMDRTVQVNKELYNIAKQIPGVQNVSLISGFSLLGGSGGNFGLGFVKLKPWDERQDDDMSVEAITGKLFGAATQVSDANILFFAPPSIPGFGASSGFELQFLDRSGGAFTDLDANTQQFLMQLMQRPEIMYAQTSFNTNYPQYEMDINMEKAKEAGVPINTILSTLQGYIGSFYAADFSKFGKQYRVYVQALPEDRTNLQSLNSIMVRNNEGNMAPITQFVTLNRVYGPQTVSRFNLFNSAAVNGAAAPGYSSGDAIRAVQEVAATSLPANYNIDFSGLTREEISAGNQTTFIFMLSVLFVYFLLAGQFESYLAPLTVLFSLPVGVMGAYFFTVILGLENNIYFQIALIMLVGLLAKNAILIVEFALQRRALGFTIAEAAYDAARARLRPILMTSFAFVIGLMPLVVATGVGAEGNKSIGSGAVGGVFVGTVIGVFVIPILFIVFQWIDERIKGSKVEEVATTDA
ncbi:MAG TPA: efflux RND transporter permease subunit [Flavobacteriaceae bacterium]|nr:efflux RND transporter permease subunit [Flavobacteriaceae bacterium]